MTDSASGYVHITPLHSKNQWNLMVQELMFAGILGHAELTFRCDKEPTSFAALKVCRKCQEINGVDHACKFTTSVFSFQWFC